MSYIEIPNVPGTPESRTAALRESRVLLKSEPSASKGVFGIESETPGEVAGSTELMNLATYIETGHSYFDLHPTGKRRPIVKVTNVTVVAPPGVDTEDLEHFLQHVNNGDFAEFLDDLVTGRAAPDQPSEGDAEKSADDN